MCSHEYTQGDLQHTQLQLQKIKGRIIMLTLCLSSAMITITKKQLGCRLKEPM